MVKTYYRVTPLTKDDVLVQLKELNFTEYVEDIPNPFVYHIHSDGILFFKPTKLWTFQYRHKVYGIEVWDMANGFNQWLPTKPMDIPTLIALYA